MATSHAETIARTVFIDRFIAEWMEGQNEYWLWEVAVLDRPLPDELIAKALAALLKLVPVLSTRPRFRFWRGHWESVDPGDLSRLVTRKTASAVQQVEELVNNAITDFSDSDPPYFRITSIDGPEEHRLVLQVHHLIVDGDGAKSVFEAFAHCCRELSRDPEWAPTGPRDMDRSWWQMIRQLRWWQFLMAPLVFHFNTLLIIVGLFRRGAIWRVSGDHTGPFPSGPPQQPGYATLIVPAQDVARLKTVMKQAGATINDAVMTAHMTAMALWNRSRNEAFRWVGSGYTGNLRRWWARPAGTFANMSCIKLLWAWEEQLTDSKTAFAALKPKLDREKRFFALDDLWLFLSECFLPEALLKLPAVMFSSLLHKVTRGIAPVTNIGLMPEDAGDFGAATASELSLIAPFFPGQGVLITLTGYKGTLTFQLGFDGEYMEAETAQAYLDLLREQLAGLSEA